MKIPELIDNLKYFHKQYGDLDCVTLDFYDDSNVDTKILDVEIAIVIHPHKPVYVLTFN